MSVESRNHALWRAILSSFQEERTLHAHAMLVADSLACYSQRIQRSLEVRSRSRGSAAAGAGAARAVVCMDRRGKGGARWRLCGPSPLRLLFGTCLRLNILWAHLLRWNLCLYSPRQQENILYPAKSPREIMLSASAYSFSSSISGQLPIS